MLENGALICLSACFYINSPRSNGATTGAGCFLFTGTQLSMPAFPHNTLPRQRMPSPSQDRLLHLNRGFQTRGLR